MTREEARAAALRAKAAELEVVSIEYPDGSEGFAILFPNMEALDAEDAEVLALLRRHDTPTYDALLRIAHRIVGSRGLLA